MTKIHTVNQKIFVHHKSHQFLQAQKKLQTFMDAKIFSTSLSS